MDYNPKCCSEAGYRFTLEQAGKKMLFVIGLNPSTADEEQADRTMSKVMQFAEKNHYDGYVMLNLSAQRATDPDNLDREPNEAMHQLNLKKIAELSERYPEADILLAFGNGIGRRRYLRTYFQDIYHILQQHHHAWKYIALTKYGHPRHPLYLSLKFSFQPFDIETYLGSLNK